jgi:hypothetical protein
VFGADGELAYIIHRVEDVTPFIDRVKATAGEAQASALLESRAQHLEAEIVMRARELQRETEQLRASEERYRRLIEQVEREHPAPSGGARRG